MIKDKTQANKHIFKSENIMVLNENTGEIIEENVIRREKTNEVIDIKFLKIWPEYLINYLLNCKNSRCIVLGFLLLHRNRRNRVYKTQREIAEETQISLPTVNKTLKELKNNEIILILPSEIIFNPDFIAYGSSKVRNELREEYLKLKVSK